MKRTMSALMLLGLALGACEESKAEEEKPKDSTAAEEAPLQVKSTEEILAEEKAAAEAAKKAAEDAAEQAKVDENPLTECCRALGRKGFTERSPEYMAASKSCGSSLEAEEKVAEALPGITKALKGKPLPTECSD